MQPTRLLVLLCSFLAALLMPASLQASAQEPLVIAEGEEPATALLYVAAAMGYFADAGVKVTLRRYATSRQALDAVLAGEAQLAAAPTPVVTERVAEGAQLGLLSLLHVSQRGTALVARTEAGIASPSDLSGKHVGMSSRSEEQFFLDTLLVSAGISPSAVIHVDLPPQCRTDPLSQAQVDAIVASSTCVHRLRRQLGEGAIEVFYSDVYTDMAVLFGNREVINSNGQRILAVLTALDRADRFIRANQRQSLQILVRALPEVDAEEVRRGWQDFAPRLGLSQALLEQMQQEAEWIHASRFSGEPPPDFRRYLMPTYLQRIAPERVTVY